MPVLPDVQREYNTNIGQMPDTSGEEHNAKVYGAIGKFSENLGNFAVDVARDLNVKAANIETTSKISQYETDKKKLLDDMGRDPNLDFVANGKQIEENFQYQMRLKRESILNDSQSYMSRSAMEHKLASAEPEEALELLKLKNQKIEESKKTYLANIENNYGSTLMSPSADFDLANKEMKRSMNDVSSIYGNYFTKEEAQKYQEKLSDFGGVQAITSMLMRKRTQEAAAQLLGSNYLELTNHMQQNFNNGVDSYVGVGIRDEGVVGLYYVHQANGQRIPFQASEEQWKKSPYMLAKEFTKRNQSLFIDGSPTNELIRYASPKAKADMYGKLFKALSDTPKQDKSLAVKIAGDFEKLSSQGKVEPNHVASVMSDEVLSNLNQAQISQVGSSLVINKVQELVNSIPKEKISTQEDILENVDVYLKNLPKEMANDPNFQKVATYLGNGDTEKGLAILQQDIMSKIQRDTFLEAAERRRVQLKSDYEKDPIATSMKSLGETPQGKAIRNKLFAGGAIKKINGLNPDEYEYIQAEHEQVKTEMKKLGDAFGISDKVVDADTEKAIRGAFDASFTDTNEVVAIVDNLKKMFGETDFAQLMVQIEKPDLVMALQNNNLKYIEDITTANKYLSSYLKTDNKAEGDLGVEKEIRGALSTNEDLKNYLNITMNHTKSSSPLIAAAMNDNAFKLTLYNMKKSGLSLNDAVERTIQSLIGDNNVLLKQKDKGYLGHKEYSVIVDKAHKLEAADIADAFDSTVGNIEWVKSQDFMLPPEMSNKEGVRYNRERFNNMVADKATVINSPDGDGFILGFKDDTNRFIPLRTSEGEQAKLSIHEIKRVRDQNKKGEDNTAWANSVKSFFTNMIVAPALSTKATKVEVKNPMTYVAPTYRLDVKERSTDHFISSPQEWEIATLQRYENPNMEKNFNKVYYNNGTYTLGGALTSSALKDVAKANGIKIPKNVTSPKAIVDYFSTQVKSKKEYDNLFTTYMTINRSYIKDELKGLPHYKKSALSDLAWVLGADAVKKSKVVALLRDEKKTPADVIAYLKNPKNGVSENFMKNYYTTINKTSEPTRRLRTVLSWK